MLVKLPPVPLTVCEHGEDHQATLSHMGVNQAGANTVYATWTRNGTCRTRPVWRCGLREAWLAPGLTRASVGPVTLTQGAPVATGRLVEACETAGQRLAA